MDIQIKDTCYIEFASFVKRIKIEDALNSLGLADGEYRLILRMHTIGRFNYFRLEIPDKGVLSKISNNSSYAVSNT